MASGFGIIPDLVGLATKIGTAIPGLKKPKKRDTSQRAARQGANRTAQAAVGGAQTGFGASRGLALRSGLRAASNAARASADAAATAEARDQQQFDSQKIARNRRLASFGTDLAAGAAQIGQGVVEAGVAGQGVPTQDVQPVVAGLGFDPEQGGAGDVAEAQELEEITGSAEGPDLADIEAEQQARAQVISQTEAALQPLKDLNPLMSSLGVPQDLQAVQRMAPEAEFKLRIQSLALEEAQRQGVPIDRVLARMNRSLDNVPQLASPFEQFGTGMDQFDEDEI